MAGRSTHPTDVRAPTSVGWPNHLLILGTPRQLRTPMAYMAYMHIHGVHAYGAAWYSYPVKRNRVTPETNRKVHQGHDVVPQEVADASGDHGAPQVQRLGVRHHLLRRRQGFARPPVHVELRANRLGLLPGMHAPACMLHMQCTMYNGVTRTRPGTAEGHRRQRTPTINTDDRQPAQLTDQAPGTIERAAQEPSRTTPTRTATSRHHYVHTAGSTPDLLSQRSPLTNGVAASPRSTLRRHR